MQVERGRLVPERAASDRARPEVRGKFLHAGGEKFYVKGVTYGTFAENAETGDFPPRDRVAADFADMAAQGINTVRVYIVPPRWLLDLAAEAGLRVFVGMPWEQHVAFLDVPGLAADILHRLEGQFRPIAGHPAILAVAIGNEIPAGVVRWHGPRAVARFLERLAARLRAIDPGALITYVNFPTTEYLELPFVDFVSFNVYLEDMERLDAYLARLHSLAGEKPLLMAEIGLDSLRNGEEVQAHSLAAQVTRAFEAGCAGTCVFAWTDEWHRGGFEIEDWDFGLTRRDRTPKPALAAVRAAYAAAPAADRDWPKISVVVCSYNGARTIGETLARLAEVDYADMQVIVVDDGSTDATAEIARGFDVELISTDNRGLSSARNTGLAASTGEIVAYIDDDAYPDPDWLTYLAVAFEKGDYAAVGGPNIGPPEDPDMAECVANAPGGPVQVLLDDRTAEHIPGCNMAFRAEALRAIGGFDPRFRVAGDDVDACWRIQDAGGVIGFAHAALVWHHRRPSIRTYFRQQRGYARAEALVAAKWPSKYNRMGHLAWHGRLYGRGLLESLTRRPRIYHGSWGSAPFQSIYAPGDSVWTALPLMPEWVALLGLGLALGLLGLDWPPLLVFLGLALAGLGVSVAMALRGALRAEFARSGATPHRRPEWQLRAVVFWLHLLQPAARLVGRIRHRLGPWGGTGPRLRPLPGPAEWRLWTETWTDPHGLLDGLRAALGEAGAGVRSGGDFDDWDLAVGGSLWGEMRAVMMTEEHGGGQQLHRLKAWPVVFPPVIALGAVAVLLAAAALAAGAAVAGAALVALALALAVVVYGALSAARATLETGLAETGAGWSRAADR